MIDTTKPAPALVTQKGKWMALTAALLGWLFDGFEMGMFPLIGKPALQELLGEGSKEAADRWFGVIMATFLIGAATGGVVFGWLGDRIGRVRAMSLSIFTYAIFTGLCGFATEAWHIAVLRFIASLGMGGEWALGVALVTEIWSDKSRAFLAGLIGAAANVGFLLVALLSLVLLNVLGGIRDLMLGMGISEGFTTKMVSNQGWRLLMVAGALPAILIFFIRLFVPESQKWEQEKAKGATSHWATKDLLGVLIGCGGAGLVIYLWSPEVQNTAVRIVGTLLGVTVALLGYLYPVYRYLMRSEAAALASNAPAEDRLGVSSPAHLGVPAASELRVTFRRLLLGAGLAGVALLGTWGALQWVPKWIAELEPDPAKHAKEYAQIMSASGAILGTILGALIAGRIGRRITYTLMCIGSFLVALLLYQANAAYGPGLLACIFLAGAVTASFYGFFPLYMPELFPTRIRATSQGFAYNFGRVIAAIGSLQTATLIAWFDGSFPKAGSALAVIYLLGIVIIWFCPETKGRPLPE